MFWAGILAELLSQYRLRDKILPKWLNWIVQQFAVEYPTKLIGYVSISAKRAGKYFSE